MGTYLVGRDREVEGLQESCAAVVSRAGAVALLVGEAGIGKTALVEMLARHATDAGIPVLVGRTVADEGAPAFWPWRRVLDEAGRCGLGGLPASLLDLRRAAGGGGQGEPTVAARFRVIEATVRALVSAAQPAGLVVILEDLQWADESSLRLLRHVCGEVREARLLVVGTVRDPDRGEQLSAAVTELIGLAAVHTVRLGAWGIPEVAAHLRQHVERFDRSWPGHIHRLVGGNPLLVRELIRLLIRRDCLTGPAGGIEVPAELRRLVGMRMAHLSAGCRALLGGCAAIGEEVDIELLHATVGGDVESLLSEAVTAGVLIDDPHSPATLCFAHDLFRQARYAELSRVQRIDWHRRIADALAATGPGDARAGELARHRVRAAVEAPGRRAGVQACQEAGAAAARRLDFDAARPMARPGAGPARRRRSAVPRRAAAGPRGSTLSRWPGQHCPR